MTWMVTGSARELAAGRRHRSRRRGAGRPRSRRRAARRAAAVRDSAAAIGLVLGLLYLFPIAAALISDPTISRHLQQISPLSAGLDVQTTIGVNSLPLTPWQGLGVVALWTADALLLGALVLKFRDA
jgi:ABC-2 type transport system permease protein